MKILFILSLLCINNAAVPPDSARQTDQKKQQQAAQKPPSKNPPAQKTPAKKTAKTPMPFYPSPVLVDLF